MQMIILTLLMLILSIFFPVPGQAADESLTAVGKQAWIKHYNGPGKGLDEATALAVDGQGNVYVTGTTYIDWYEMDIATIKYDTNGKQKWVRRYNGPRSYDGVEKATAIAVDGQGNVYITGSSYDWLTDDDFVTIKYDTDGKRKWVQRYNGTINYSDCAKALAVDGQGNVYVTGNSRDSYPDTGITTIKYDTNGNQHWVQHYNNTSYFDDDAKAIAVDSQGNVYVTGASYGAGDPFTFEDYVTIKYDTNGIEQWVRRYNGPGNGSDEPAAITVDGQGNVYVTGTSQGKDTYDDYATIKYDTNGKRKWVRRYNGPLSAMDEATAIAVDGHGNVYVTGSSMYTTYSVWNVYGYATIKYDTNGKRKWVRRYKGPDWSNSYATSIAVDSQSNSYVTGTLINTISDYDCVTIKYDTNGKLKWKKSRNRLYDTYYQDPINSKIALDGQGNAYVTGNTYNNTVEHDYDYDYETIKYLNE